MPLSWEVMVLDTRRWGKLKWSSIMKFVQMPSSKSPKKYLSWINWLQSQICLIHFSRDVPMERTRFLGAISGMAEYVNGSVIFCRHSSCWKLNVIKNQWKQVLKSTLKNNFTQTHVFPSNQLLGGRIQNSSGPCGFSCRWRSNLNPRWQRCWRQRHHRLWSLWQWTWWLET